MRILELGLTQKQIQTISPQMIQTMEVLQMSAQELLEYVQEAMQENPVMETEETPEKKSGDDLRRRLEWLSRGGSARSSERIGVGEDEGDLLRNYGEPEEETLYAHLRAQIDALEAEPETKRCAELLAQSLNSSGWLDESTATLAAELGVTPEKLNAALELLQSLEPAGVGARNLAECLCLQLEREEPKDILAICIARSRLEALARNHYGLLARELHADPAEVRRACDHIRALNPRPGANFGTVDNAIYIVPDVILRGTPGNYELAGTDDFFPSLRISSYYSQLLEETDDAEVREYLNNKLRQAKWVIQALEQRRNTLMSCVRCILELQEEFFRLGPGHLAPMSLMDVAERIGVHESTVSRAIRGKYLQCSMGTFALSDFFSTALGSNGGQDAVFSPDAAKAMMKKLIAEEDPEHPFSDQKLCDRLNAAGCRISRRTVAKYRDEMNIPGTGGRKRVAPKAE